MKDRAEFGYKMQDIGKRAVHTLGWHLWHAPMNALRVLWFAACGLFYIVGSIWVWTFDLHSPKQEFTSEEYVKLNQNRERRLSQRGQVVGYGAGTIGLVGLIVWWATPPWVSWGLLVAVVIVLALVGRPRDKPFIMPATIAPGEDTPLTADVVFEALCSLGIPKMTKPEDIQLLFAVKPSRAGYIIDITLPRGVTATEVMAKREKLSSGLQRGIGTVWPSVGERHAGHLVLFISHVDMSRARQKTWPLLKEGTVDVFKPVPMFTDQRGEWIDLRIATTSGVVGAVPRMGKTYFLRELALVGALDLRVEEYIFELKGTGDLSCTKMFAHYYSDSDEEEDIAEHLIVMRKLRAERRKRAKTIRSLPNEECPRSEVTTELSSRRSLGLHPILVIVDEVQVWTEHEVKTIREEFIMILEDLVRRGPAVGIMVYVATQKVDAKSIPTGISANAVVRVCFKVNDATSNNQILGPGSYASGIQATMFDFEKDKGIAYLKDGGTAQIVRTVSVLDKVESDKVALRARGLRQQANRLTGYAAGEEVDTSMPLSLVDEILALFGNANTMHLGDIAAGLAERHPATWGQLDAKGLGVLLRSFTPPIEPVTVYVADKSASERSAKGLKREQLDTPISSETSTDSPTGTVRQLRSTGGF
jgi:S-DNA-T family DNA segregation ATPase FtsK/SpoIIIE